MRALVVLAALCTLIPMGASRAAEVASSGIGGKVALTRVSQQLPAGDVWFTLQTGAACVDRESLKGDGVLKSLPLKTYAALFKREFGSGNQRNTLPNLFASETGPDGDAPFEIGALITRAHMEVCLASINSGSGDAYLYVTWQVFSRVSSKVVGSVETVGRARAVQGTSRLEVVEQLTDSAFADAAEKLRFDSTFRGILAKAPAEPPGSVPATQARIVLDGGRPSPRPVAEAAGAVVLITTPGGAFGSGVLVSTDGYILTDAHVVELNKTVKIRWSDGFEASGEVLRLHKKRDVALVKTDPHGRTPLPLRTTRVEPGETVLAISAPLERDLQGTITRGIVSANRVMDDFSFIQSDVAINHGNSGGPLLDEKGYVIALTDLSWQPQENVQIGINFFTPIKDALDFLKLDLKTGPPPAQRASAPATRGKARKR